MTPRNRWRRSQLPQRPDPSGYVTTKGVRLHAGLYVEEMMWTTIRRRVNAARIRRTRQLLNIATRRARRHWVRFEQRDRARRAA